MTFILFLQGGNAVETGVNGETIKSVRHTLTKEKEAIVRENAEIIETLKGQLADSESSKVSMEEDHNDAMQLLKMQLETEKKDKNKLDNECREKVSSLEMRLEGFVSDLKTSRRRAEGLEVSLALAQRYDEYTSIQYTILTTIFICPCTFYRTLLHLLTIFLALFIIQTLTSISSSSHLDNSFSNTHSQTPIISQGSNCK